MELLPGSEHGSLRCNYQTQHRSSVPIPGTVFQEQVLIQLLCKTLFFKTSIFVYFGWLFFVANEKHPKIQERSVGGAETVLFLKRGELTVLCKVCFNVSHVLHCCWIILSAVSVLLCWFGQTDVRGAREDFFFLKLSVHATQSVLGGSGEGPGWVGGGAEGDGYTSRYALPFFKWENGQLVWLLLHILVYRK